jgi:stage II sporulation protein E
MKDAELERNADGTEGILEKWLSRYVIKEKTSEKARGGGAARGVLSFFVAAVFSVAEGVGGTLPFGIALISGSEKRVPYMAAGVLLVYVVTGNVIYAVSAVLILALRLLVCLVLEGKKRDRLFTEPVAVRMAIGAAGGFVSGIYGIFDGGFAEQLLYEAIFLIAVVPMSAYVFSGALSRQSTDWGRKEIASAVLYAVLISGLGKFSFIGFSPSTVAAAALTLCTALRGGALKGALAGMIGGVCGGGGIVPLGLMGAVGGALRKRHEAVAVGGACGVSAAICVLTLGRAAFISTLPALLWGGAICLPLSRFGILSSLSVFKDGLKNDVNERALVLSGKRELELSARLGALSEAMTGLSGVFYALSNRLCTPDAYKVRQICEGAFKKYCQKCGSCSRCWSREYERTADVMRKLSSAVIRHGSADSSYVPEWFLSSCPNVLKALSEVNLTHARLLEDAAKQNKTEVFALDYEAMARLLTEASEENAAEYEIDHALSERVRRAALGMEMGFNSIAVYGKRKKTVIAGGVELERVRINASEMGKRLSDAAGVPLTAPEFRLDDGYVTMTASTRRTVNVESARATSKKQDERVNGDSTAVFENREERFYALISDGMGSGEEASLTSKMTAIFLEKLLYAGNRKHTVLKMLNNFIRHKNLECFSTVDLLEIDTLGAEASFVKSGAAASYVIREGKLFRIASTSLPIGITREIASEEIRFGIKDGDLIVMISDGVSQSFEDGVWLLTMLSEELDPDAPANVIAGSILDRARKNNGRSDDMTVIAVKVEIEE